MRRPARPAVLIVSCEHGGREVPPAYAGLFAGHEALLQSHRGWDPGALELGLQFAEATGAPCHAATVTRLLVDLNRSIGNRGLYSEITRPLPAAERREIVARYYRPHRDAIEADIARRIASGHRVLHVASHSFTPTLDGVDRRADVGWLYDPRRAGEVGLAAAWLADFAARAPGLVLRRNYPYRGRSDGLTALMRSRYPDEAYVGVELEVNQRFFAASGAPWSSLRAALTASLMQALV